MRRAIPRATDLDPVLAGALILALALRAWGVSYDLPHVYNPDEISILSRALALADGDLNPHNFLYPSFYFYVLAAAVGAWFVVSRVLGLTGSLAEFEAAFWQDPSALYLVGRTLSIAGGVATVAAVYALTRRVGTRSAARAAALLLACAYVPVRDAHFVKHDVPVTLLIVLAVLAAWRVWQDGRTRWSVAAGALAGAAFAAHYYAMFAIVPVLVAAMLRQAGSSAAAGRTRTTAAALAAFGGTFAVLSPYVLIDFATAWRDIQANRAIVVSRGLETFGPLGAAGEHVRILAYQGAGIPMLAAAVAGAVVLVRRDRRAAAWLLSFPLVFLIFIANSWPFGRTANALYPFVAACAGLAIEAAAARIPRPRMAAWALIAACAAYPLALSVRFDRLLTRDDTRTLARAWIEAHVPHGATVLLEPYSVPLEPSRAWLREIIVKNVGSVDAAGYRVRRRLARPDYPAAAYRILHVGEGGMDEDKAYVPAGDLVRDGALPAHGIDFVILKRVRADESSPLRERVRAAGRLVHAVSPFVPGTPADAHAQLPDYDIRPSWRVDRPGPLIEVWRLSP